MVIKVKVSDVARDFGKTNKEIIEILSQYCGGAAKRQVRCLKRMS